MVILSMNQIKGEKVNGQFTHIFYVVFLSQGKQLN